MNKCINKNKFSSTLVKDFLPGQHEDSESPNQGTHTQKIGLPK